MSEILLLHRTIGTDLEWDDTILWWYDLKISGIKTFEKNIRWQNKTW